MIIVEAAHRFYFEMYIFRISVEHHPKISTKTTNREGVPSTVFVAVPLQYYLHALLLFCTLNSHTESEAVEANKAKKEALFKDTRNLTENFSSFSPSPTASLKSFGEKTASLFDRKKKDAEKLAADKAAEAQKIAEEQARKVGEEIGKTKSEAEALAASTGEDCGWQNYRLSESERKKKFRTFIRESSRVC